MRLFLSTVLLIAAAPTVAETLTYRVIIGGVDTGHMTIERDGNDYAIEFDFKQNGRGPTYAESITVDVRGYPVSWTITGQTTFGSEVDEYMRVEDGVARWQDTTGESDATIDGESLMYVSQHGSPYPQRFLAEALLNDDDQRINVYPAGEASIRERDTMTFDGAGGEVEVTAYEILGLSLKPTTDRAGRRR